jgi:hypothetical protein
MTDKTEKRELTATQLFSRYVAARDKVSVMARTLVEETRKADALAEELATKHGLYVGGKPPVGRTIPATEPSPAYEGETEPGDETGTVDYTPPTQSHTAEAPRIGGSAEVAEIRAGAGLNVEAGDSETLAAEGMGAMEALQRGMGGKAAIVPSPGEMSMTGAEPASNEGGGPTAQKPVGK